MAKPGEDTPLNQVKVKTIDTILSRFGFGAYQKYVFYIAGMGQVADGIELTAIAVLTPVLQDEWDLSVGQMGLMGGVIFVGMILGNAIAAYLGDTMGRLPLMQRSTLLLFTAAFLSGLMPEFWSFTCTRFFVGIADGMILPIASCYATEVCPKENRGKYLVGMGICFVFGTLLVIVLAIFFISSFGGASWRYILLVAALPALIAYFMLLFVIRESPRFFASVKRSEDAIAELNYIGSINQQPRLSIEEEEGVRQYEQLEMDAGFSKVGVLFNSHYRRVTMSLLLLWFAAVFSYYGLLFILPQTLHADSRSDTNIMMLVTALIQIPATAVNVLTIDHPAFGRKTSMSLCLLGQALCLAAAVLTVGGNWMFMTSSGLCIFFIAIWFSTLYPYTGELYHTNLRSLAYGTLNVFARCGGAIGPIVLLELKSLGEEYPYVLLASVSIVATICAVLLPFETRNSALDQDLSLPSS